MWPVMQVLYCRAVSVHHNAYSVREGAPATAQGQVHRVLEELAQLRVLGCERVCVRERDCVRVCVRVCVREREGERGRERVCVCVTVLISSSSSNYIADPLIML